MFNYKNYDVEKIIFESDIQRILLCKNNEGKLFYNNIVLRKRLIDLVDAQDYPENSDNIIAIEKTEDRLYIFSKHTKMKTLKSFIQESSITYRERVELTELLLEKFKELEYYSDIQAQSMMTEDNILVDEDLNIYFKNLLIFSQDYDIEANEIIKNTSNYIHFIFSGKYIENFKIDEDIPPDIIRIIKRAGSNEYANIEELKESFKKSPTYSLILPLGLKKKNSQGSSNEQIGEKNNNKEVQKNNPKRLLIIGIIAIIIIPIIILLLTNKDDNTDNINNQQDIENENNSDDSNQNYYEEETGDENKNLPETISDFYNEETIKEESTDYAEMDYTKLYDGYYSLKIDNNTEKEKKYLFSIIDLNSDDYKYLKNREIGISVRLTSDKDMEGNLIIEIRKNGEISSSTSEKVTLNSQSWLIKQRSLVLSDNDEIKLFFQYKEEGNIWIDSIEVDVLK